MAGLTSISLSKGISQVRIWARRLKVRSNVRYEWHRWWTVNKHVEDKVKFDLYQIGGCVPPKGLPRKASRVHLMPTNHFSTCNVQNLHRLCSISNLMSRQVIMKRGRWQRRWSELYNVCLSFGSQLLTSPRLLSLVLATCVQIVAASGGYHISNVLRHCFASVNGAACGGMDIEIPTA